MVIFTGKQSKTIALAVKRPRADKGGNYGRNEKKAAENFCT